MHLFSIRPCRQCKKSYLRRQWLPSVLRCVLCLQTELSVERRGGWVQRLEEALFSPPHRHISLLIAITLNLPRCLNTNSQLIKRGSPQVDRIKSFFSLQFAAHSLRVAHDCSPPAPAEDCVARLWVWEHKSSAPVSYDARLWSAAGRGNCQPIHHNNKRPRDSALSAQVLHVLLHSNTSPLQTFPFFSQPFRIIISLTPWSWVTGGVQVFILFSFSPSLQVTV